MPKLKTKKGVSKRYRLTKKGKIKYHAGGKSHLLSHKKSRRLRSLRRVRAIENRQEKKYLRRMLPYG